MIKTYVEYTAYHSAFVLVTDNCDMKPVSGKFDTAQEATDWGVNNGYIVNRYEEGKLEETKLPRPISEIMKESGNFFNISEFQESIKEKQNDC